MIPLECKQQKYIYFVKLYTKYRNNYIFNMIHTLQRNWNVLTSIYNIVALLVCKCVKMQISFFFFFIGNSKDAQVAVQQTHMYITCKFTVVQVCPLNPLQKHD